MLIRGSDMALGDVVALLVQFNQGIRNVIIRASCLNEKTITQSNMGEGDVELF